MQDYPKLLNSTGEVGFTMYETWYCYSPAKNNILDAANCIAQGIPSCGAAEAEFNFYNWTNRMLLAAGVKVELETQKTDYNKMSFAFGPKILMDPMFAITFREIKVKFAGKNQIHKNASMILSDRDIFFENLDLDKGTLICENGKKVQKGETKFIACDMKKDGEVIQMRGYKTLRE